MSSRKISPFVKLLIHKEKYGNLTAFGLRHFVPVVENH